MATIPVDIPLLHTVLKAGQTEGVFSVDHNQVVKKVREAGRYVFIY